jgi:hypothetical protein
MASLSTADVHDMLRAKFGSTAPSAKPAAYEVCLSSTALVMDAAGVLSGAREPVGAGYAPITLPNDNANITIADRAAVTATAGQWTVGTGGWDVQPGYAFLREAGTSRIVGWAPLSGTPTGTAGEVIDLPAGAIRITSPSA